MTKSRRALIIVDVQPAFLRPRHAVVRNICKLLRSQKYDLYAECVFFAEIGSLWDRQTRWICPKSEKTATVSAIMELLPQRNTIHIVKSTKSAFKGTKDLAAMLRRKKISEVHVVGLDANDCVLATAYESFDLGFETYVLEDCCDSSSSERLRKQAFALLRHVSILKKVNIK